MDNLYLKEVSYMSNDELKEELNRLCDILIPTDLNDPRFLIEFCLQLFGIEDFTDLDFKALNKKYYKALHFVTTLHIQFIENDILTLDPAKKIYLMKFNKVFEIFHYVEQTIRSLFLVNNASKPTYDSTMNMDIGLYKYNIVDIEFMTPFQQLLLYMYRRIEECGYKRQRDMCMERVLTDEGYDTKAWKACISINDFCYMQTQKDINMKQWRNFTIKGSNRKDCVSYLETAIDPQFPDIEKDRHLFSFNNGIYETCIHDRENDIYYSKWHPYLIDYGGVDPNELEHDRVSCKYFDQEFEDYTNIEDWYDIPTPCFQSILDYQKFPEEVCRWMYILICGRILYEVGELDEWQIIPYLIGLAKSGKSTLVTRVCKEFYDVMDVGVLSNNIEKKFGLSALKDKLLFIAPEIKDDIALEQCDFQTIVSGEETSVPTKFKTAKPVKWKVPSVWAGNQSPGYTDNSGSIGRRIFAFFFKRKVKNANTRLGKDLLDEIPLLIQKGNLAYLDIVNKYGGKDIWDIAPDYFIQTQKNMTEKTHSLAAFIHSERVFLADGEFCSMHDFISEFNEFTREHAYKRQRFEESFYGTVFYDNGIQIVKENPITKEKGEFLVGIDLTNNHNNHSDTGGFGDMELIEKKDALEIA